MQRHLGRIEAAGSEPDRRGIQCTSSPPHRGAPAVGRRRGQHAGSPTVDWAWRPADDREVLWSGTVACSPATLGRPAPSQDEAARAKAETVRSSRKKPAGRPSASFPPAVRCLQVKDSPDADRTAWQEACRSGGLLTEPGPAMLYAENTRRKAADGWGRFLNFLDLAGELEQGETPAQRLTADRVGQFIVSLRG